MKRVWVCLCVGSAPSCFMGLRQKPQHNFRSTLQERVLPLRAALQGHEGRVSTAIPSWVGLLRPRQPLGKELFSLSPLPFSTQARSADALVGGECNINHFNGVLLCGCSCLCRQQPPPTHHDTLRFLSLCFTLSSERRRRRRALIVPGARTNQPG